MRTTVVAGTRAAAKESDVTRFAARQRAPRLAVGSLARKPSLRTIGVHG